MNTKDMTYRMTLGLAGSACAVATNDVGLLNVLNVFRNNQTNHFGGFDMHILVHDEPAGDEPEEEDRRPHFRGLHHLVFASFGQSNRFVCDIESRRITAAVSRRLAHDRAFWHERMLPIAVGVLGAAVGVLPLHAACLSVAGEGLLIAGTSGAGKSTLSVALAQRGFAFVSDDWTYISCDEDGIEAHGSQAPVKLLPDALRHFPELAQHSVSVSMNGEPAYEVDPADTFSVAVTSACRPRWLVFFEREQDCHTSAFEEVTPGAASEYIETSVERMPPQLLAATRKRDSIKKQIGQLPCWRFCHGGTPQSAAEALHAFVARQIAGGSGE